MKHRNRITFGNPRTELYRNRTTYSRFDKHRNRITKAHLGIKLLHNLTVAWSSKDTVTHETTDSGKRKVFLKLRL